MENINPFQGNLCKIVYKDGDFVRVIKAVLLSEDDFFLTVKTKENTYRIGKGCVQNIKLTNGEGQHG